MTTANRLISGESQKKSLVTNVIRVQHLPIKQKGSVFSYNDPILGKSFSSPPTANDDSVLPVSVDRVIYTSDASPSTCQLSLVDPHYSSYNFKNKLRYYGSNNTNAVIPQIGDGIVVWMYNDRSNLDSATKSNIHSKDGWVKIFKGYVTSVGKSISSNGSKYTISCEDIKVRLKDNCIKKVYNNSYKIASIPNLLEKQNVLENPYTTERLTVKEILEDIFDYAHRIASVTGGFDEEKLVYFKFSDLDFNGNNDLKGFIPQTLSFDNITILEAIYRTINSYGNYRLVLDYDDDKLYITKLSYGAKNCGDKITVQKKGSKSFIEYIMNNQNSTEWHETNLISDNTYRRTKENCSILRCYSAPIEWYSGHYYIRSNYSATVNPSTGSTTFIGSSNEFNIKGWNKSDKRFYLRNKNFDGYDYVFGGSAIMGMGDSFKEPFFIVGAPLYPTWNVYQGYKARKVYYDGYVKYKYDRYSDSKDPQKKAQEEVVMGAITEKLGCTENDAYGFVDPDFQSVMSLTSAEIAKGYTYEAWFPYGVCWCCDGYGAVGFDAAEYYDVFGKTRNMDGSRTTVSCPSGSFDYGFTTITDKNGKDITVPTKHPIPWTNTCPVCRGTGVEPWFRMVNILNTLVDITPDQTKMGENENNKTISTYGQGRDKTFSDIAQQRSLRKNATLYIEDVGGDLVYDRAKLRSGDTTITHTMADERTLFNSSNKIFQNNEKYINGLHSTTITEMKGFNIDSARGLVILREKKNIPCYRQQYGISPVEKVNYSGKKLLPIIWDNSTGTGYVKYSGKGTMSGTHQKSQSYWRPARAWLSCYFTRDMFKSSLGSNFTGTTNFKSYFIGKQRQEVTRDITSSNSDPEDGKKYYISAGVEDNRYYIEITGKNNYGTDYNVRPTIVGTNMDSFKWQICPFDFGRWNVPAFTPSSRVNGSISLNKITVPSSYENMWAGVYKGTIKKSYMFPTGSLWSTEEMNDEEMKSLGYSPAQIQAMQRSDIFPKVYRWIHRDDRVKMIDRGIAELERKNDVQVTGTIAIRGGAPKFKKGFGYVLLSEIGEDFATQDSVKACIVKIELDMTNGCVMNLEVSTEEMRVGIKNEAEQDYNRKLETLITSLNYNAAYSINSIPSGYIQSQTRQDNIGGLNVGN